MYVPKLWAISLCIVVPFTNNPMLFNNSMKWTKGAESYLSQSRSFSSVCPHFIHCLALMNKIPTSDAAPLYMNCENNSPLREGWGWGGDFSPFTHWYQSKPLPSNNATLFLSGLFIVYLKSFNITSEWLGSLPWRLLICGLVLRD